MSKFKVGDRVRVIHEYPRGILGSVCDGDTGVLISIHPDPHYAFPYMVRFHDEYICSVAEIELIQQPVIVITTDGKTTTATKRLGKKVLGTATARCNPGDKFDFDIGAELAFRRLREKERPVPKEEPWPKKLVCAGANRYTEDFRIGRVFRVEQFGSDKDYGHLYLEDGSHWDLRRHSDTEFRINNYPDYALFIPLVED